jgi:hypothetical protein
MTHSKAVADNNVAYYPAYKYCSLQDLQSKYHDQYSLVVGLWCLGKGLGRLPCPEMKYRSEEGWYLSAKLCFAIPCYRI